MRHAVLVLVALFAGLVLAGEKVGSAVALKLQAIAAQKTLAPQSARHVLLLDALPVAASGVVARVYREVEGDLAVAVRLARGAAPEGVAVAAGWPADTNCVAVVVLAARGDDYPVFTFEPTRRRALVNCDPLATADAALYEKRLRQAVNRAFGLVLGVGYVVSTEPPDALTPALERTALDAAAPGLSMVAAQRWRQMAQEAGLEQTFGVSYRQLTVRGVMPPLNPDLWQGWEKRHGKSVAKTLKELGFDDPATAMAELKGK